MSFNSITIFEEEKEEEKEKKAAHAIAFLYAFRFQVKWCGHSDFSFDYAIVFFSSSAVATVFRLFFFLTFTTNGYVSDIQRTKQAEEKKETIGKSNANHK